MIKSQLPIDEALEPLAEALAAGHAVLCAPTGSGKTTAVPLALLDQPWLAGRRILLLEPRRPAARMAARRMAAMLGEQVGETVGYQVRLDRRIGPNTRIEVLTEGLLTRRLQNAPELDDVGLVIFDEFHERSLQADLGLALCLDVCAGLREDLRLLVMSATLDAERVSSLLAGRVVRGSGSSHPVTVDYLPPGDRRESMAAMPALVRHALDETEGDVLVFLPGQGEIRRFATELGPSLPRDVSLAPLYGELSAAEQDRVLGPPPTDQRRVILSTDIAETSLTIQGVTAVVDSGQARKPVFDPNCGLTRLALDWISKASADQRAGRAGRLAPGRCYRAWEEARQQRLEADIRPEILQADLTPLVLELALWGVTDPATLGWLDPPPLGPWQQGVSLLQQLDALDRDGRITAQGRRIAGLGLHPRLGQMLVSARNREELQLAADLAALLSDRDPLLRTADLPRAADLGLRLQALMDWRGGVRRPAGFDHKRLAGLDQLGSQLARRVKLSESAVETRSAAALLTLAFPDRVAQRRPGGEARYRLAGGRGAQLAMDDSLAAAPLLVVAEMDAGKREGRIWQALALTEDELRQVQAAHLEERDAVVWDDARQAVTARRERRFGELLLSSLNRPLRDTAAASGLLLAQLARHWPEGLNWDEESRQLQIRVGIMAALAPEAGWPDLSDAWLQAHLDEWLGPWLAGASSFADVRAIDLCRVLKGVMGWQQEQELDRQLPPVYETPAGSRRRLHYQAEGSPVLAVPLQEVFGLTETPTLAGGRLPLQLQLLSPAQRPVQVTQDLAHFWANAYVEVRKELKGRYPKHDWPQDPANTPARRGTGRQRQQR